MIVCSMLCQAFEQITYNIIDQNSFPQAGNGYMH